MRADLEHNMRTWTASRRIETQLGMCVPQVIFHSGAGLYNSTDNTADIIRSHQAITGRKLSMPQADISIEVSGENGQPHAAKDCVDINYGNVS